MVGNHKSGRKPNPYGGLERSKKYTFYVKEYAHTDHNGNIDQWIEEPYFQWFKRHHGARWQEVVRNFMRADVKAWKTYHHWRCDCDPIGILENWKHKRQSQCHKCGKYRNKAEQIMNMTPAEKREYYESLRATDDTE
jgi:hypothetical protein